MKRELEQKTDSAEDDKPMGDRCAISVIIPAYNMAEYIGQAIRSALRGKFDNLEVVVIDDGSTDTTRSEVAKYSDSSSSSYDPRVRYESQSNSGKSVAVNRGVRISCGRYITILDADDQLTSTSLSLRYSALEERDEATPHLVIGEFEVFDHEGKSVGHRPVQTASDSESLYKSFFLSHKSPFHLNACLFSRELYERAGPFDTQLRRCQDIDYSIRLLKATNQVAWVREPVYRYRKHRSDYIERARIRRKTLTHRPLVYWKNYEGWRRYAAVLTGVLLDTGKFFYEMTGNYQN